MVPTPDNYIKSVPVDRTAPMYTIITITDEIDTWGKVNYHMVKLLGPALPFRFQSLLMLFVCQWCEFDGWLPQKNGPPLTHALSHVMVTICQYCPEDFMKHAGAAAGFKAPIYWIMYWIEFRFAANQNIQKFVRTLSVYWWMVDVKSYIRKTSILVQGRERVMACCI